MLEYLSIGQIVNIHGVHGEVKIYPLTDDMNRFKKLTELYVEAKGELKAYEIESVKFLSSTVVIKLKGVDTVEAAQALRNLYVKIERNKAVKLPKHSYFICDLIGVLVFDVDGNCLGEVSDVMHTGSNDVYVVKNEKKEILVPALKSIILDVDMEKRTMLVDLPEGLMDI